MREQEVKLAFDTVEAARAAVGAAGARLASPRRLQDDQLFDTADHQLQRSGSALRLRREPARGLLTFKGPIEPGPIKSREEIETPVADADRLEAIQRALGFTPVFRYQKFREEYGLDEATICIDETPIGVFVEIEAAPEAIARAAGALGRATADYIADSYRTLYARWCQANGRAVGDMVFADTNSAL